MQNNFSTSNYYLNAAMREAQIMSLHPYSREQKLQQINSLRQKAASKEIVNEQRRKQQL